MQDQRKSISEIDSMLNEAGLTRTEIAHAFCITPQRTGQILNGKGISYALADDLQRYINRRAGRMICRNEHFISRTGKEGKRRR